MSYFMNAFEHKLKHTVHTLYTCLFYLTVYHGEHVSMYKTAYSFASFRVTHCVTCNPGN